MRTGRSPEPPSTARNGKALRYLALSALGTAALYIVASRNYVLFHSIAELYSIVIAVTIFILAYSTRDLAGHGYLLFLGTAYLFIAFIDLMHTLAYKGVNVLPGGSNAAIQLWIGARSFQAGVLLASPVFFKRRFALTGGMAVFGLLSVSLLLSVFRFQTFPECFVEGAGLTRFKITAEYAIVAVLLGALWLYFKKFPGRGEIKSLLMFSIALAILSELLFTLYVSVYGPANFAGHVFKIASFGALYGALIRENLRDPLSFLFQDLREEKERYAIAAEKLSRANEELQVMNEEANAMNEELKARQVEIGEANAKLLEVSRAKSDFLANMSHELRTPLNSIIGFSELLQDGVGGPLSDRQREYIGDVLASGRHLLGLINDILDLAKVESGKMELEVGRFGLKDVLGGCMTMFREKAMKHGLRMTLDVEPGADIVVEGDERKLKQIMFNLLGNSVKFTPDGGAVRVSARKMQGSEQCFTCTARGASDFAEISVEDTGIGIRAEDMGKLFKEFTQLESPYTKEYAGTGLGLALTKRLVELHGGSIRAESEHGKRTKMTFTLPVSRPARGL